MGSYHSYGRSRVYNLQRYAQGDPYKVPLDKDDPVENMNEIHRLG